MECSSRWHHTSMQENPRNTTIMVVTFIGVRAPSLGGGYVRHLPDMRGRSAMLKFFVLVSTSWFSINHRAQAARRRDNAGLATLEIVIITLGLLLLATALIGVIGAAVRSRMNQIN